MVRLEVTMKYKIFLFLTVVIWLLTTVIIFGFIIPAFINARNDGLLLASLGLGLIWGVGSIVAFTIGKKWLKMMQKENKQEEMCDY